MDEFSKDVLQTSYCAERDNAAYKAQSGRLLEKIKKIYEEDIIRDLLSAKKVQEPCVVERLNDIYEKQSMSRLCKQVSILYSHTTSQSRPEIMRVFLNQEEIYRRETYALGNTTAYFMGNKLSDEIHVLHKEFDGSSHIHRVLISELPEYKQTDCIRIFRHMGQQKPSYFKQYPKGAIEICIVGDGLMIISKKCI
jgi:hypothetical protein